MARTSDIEDDEERWDRAESILAKNPTPAAEHQIRRKRTLAWLIVVTGVVLGAAVGLLIALTLHHRSHPSDDVATWQVICGLGLQVVALLLLLAGLVLQRRINCRRMRWNMPEAMLSWGQRRGLMKQIRGQEPIDPRRLGLARDLASRLASQRGVLLLLMGLSVMFIGQAIATPSVWRLAFAGGYLVLFGAGSVAQGRLARQARRFLDENPAPELAPAD